MNDLIYEKLDEVRLAIRNNEKIQRMKRLKKEIYEDSKLKEQLDSFHNIWNDEYSSSYVELKKAILSNPKVSEYKELENELYFTVLDINKELNTLVNKRKC